MIFSLQFLNVTWFFVGLVAGGVVVGLWFRLRIVQLQNIQLAELRKEKELLQERIENEQQLTEKMKETFDALASRALKENSDELIKRSQEQVSSIVTPLKESLTTFDRYVRELEEKREGAYQGLQEQIRQLNQSYVELRNSTTTLTSALKAPVSRGRWGELQLRRIVELAGMVEHVDFDEQTSADGARPDMLVYLPNAGLLPVDAKVPLNAYMASLEADTEESRRKNLQRHAKAIKERIRELSQRQYWEHFDKTPEFVVMFVPNESFLAAAFEVEPDIYEYAMGQRILIVTPVTLLALLKAVAFGWQQGKISENARRIAKQGQELYKRLDSFIGHLVKLQKNLQRVITTYNEAVGSLEHRVLPAIRKLKELGIAEDDIGQVKAIESSPHLPIQER